LKAYDTDRTFLPTSYTNWGLKKKKSIWKGEAAKKPKSCPVEDPTKLEYGYLEKKFEGRGRGCWGGETG